MRRGTTLALGAVAALIGSTVAALPAAADEPLTRAVTTQREMVVTTNPLATEAGEQILRNGGTAADAFVAVQTVLGLVEPQSTGIGGGSFVVYHDAATDTTTTYDAREKAPLAATEDRFAGLGFIQAWQSGLSVGVPGNPEVMEVLHEAHGRLPWQRLFTPAKTLAQGGFPLSERTADQVNGLLASNPSCTDRLFFRDPVAFAYFTNGSETDCAAKPAGTTIRNKDYADTMKALAKEGADAVYTGPIAEALVDAVNSDLNIPGDMTLDDLAAYDVVERAPVCIDYRGHEVCGMGPPSSGALAVGQMLGILENFDLGDDPLGVEAVHLFAEAGRLAFADRNLYVGDPDFVTVPTEGMLDKDYLASRAALITDTDMGTAAPGTPPGDFDPTGPQLTDTENGTSHLSIIDRWGNALSVTTTVESSFGNGVMVPGAGFLLNNELTDFSFAAVGGDGQPIANRVEPGKRPRSSMSPRSSSTRGRRRVRHRIPRRIADHRLHGPVHRQPHRLRPRPPGGGQRPALHEPQREHRPRTAHGRCHDRLRRAGTARRPARARGHPVNIVEQSSGLSIIAITDDGFVGGADPRRDGTVGGR